jgi:hypothetical protein
MTPRQLTDKLQAACGARLRSVILYGSAAAGDFSRKRSDYNVLVVLDQIGMDELKAIAKATRPWTRAGNPPPVLFTADRLARSADVFAIEIADMKTNRRVLFGDDAVASLEVDDGNLRRQLESELESALIALRERYLLTRGRPRDVTELLIQSSTAFLVLFRAALRLYQGDVPAHKIDTLKALERHIAFDPGPFQIVEQMKKSRRVPGTAPDALFARYLRTTEVVVDAIVNFLHREDSQRGSAPV